MDPGEVHLRPPQGRWDKTVEGVEVARLSLVTEGLVSKRGGLDGIKSNVAHQSHSLRHCKQQPSGVGGSTVSMARRTEL